MAAINACPADAVDDGHRAAKASEKEYFDRRAAPTLSPEDGVDSRVTPKNLLTDAVICNRKNSGLFDLIEKEVLKIECCLQAYRLQLISPKSTFH